MTMESSHMDSTGIQWECQVFFECIYDIQQQFMGNCADRVGHTNMGSKRVPLFWGIK